MISTNRIVGALVYRVREALNANSDFMANLPEYMYHPNCLFDEKFHLWHYPGTHSEISRILIDIDKAQNGNFVKMPAIFNFLPVRQVSTPDNTGGRTTAYLNLAIVASTNSAWLSEQREVETFDLVLRPIYRELLRQISRLGFVIKGYGDVRHTMYEVFTTGDRSNSLVDRYGEFVDAIEIHNLELAYRSAICSRTIKQLDVENDLVTADIADILGSTIVPPPANHNVVDTSRGTITPETVLFGKIGFSQGLEVRGVLDITQAIADATEAGIAQGEIIGRDNFIATMDDLTATPSVLHAGETAMTRSGEQIVGTYLSSETYEQGFVDGQAHVIEGQTDANIMPNDVLAGKVGFAAGNTRVVGTLVPAGSDEPDWPTDDALYLWVQPITTSNVTISLSTVTSSVNVNVDFGDGSPIESHSIVGTTGKDVLHTYDDPLAVYRIRIERTSGTVPLRLGRGLATAPYSLVGVQFGSNGEPSVFDDKRWTLIQAYLPSWVDFYEVSFTYSLRLRHLNTERVVANIYSYTFRGLNAIKRFNVPRPIGSIAMTANMVSQLSVCEELVVAEGYTSMPLTVLANTGTMNAAAALKRIDFPTTITNYSGGTSTMPVLNLLERVIFRRTIPPTITAEWIRIMRFATIYVPNNSLGAYRLATNFVNHPNIRPLSEIES